ncbi:MAG: ribulose-phosphate 3-epimerase [Ignavibacteria bacterium]
MSKKISPSILSADFSKLGEEIKEIEVAGADMIHCDIMDGHFVPNISYGPYIVKTVDRISRLPLDVHLMIEHPEHFISDFVNAGAEYISVHYENNYHLDRIINYIKSYKVKAGVALNPATPVDVLTEIIDNLDFVLLMSVNPGFGGQKFISYVLQKISTLDAVRTERKGKFLIEVDGGIGSENAREIAEAGADILVCGASIFMSADKAAELKKIKNAIS